MFYSQTILARKGPLGTVWTAAHLQNRLNKSQYTSTNIPQTIELIMFPEVPMALRMSSHLLLGVVRIYSKQVDYFFRDCSLFTTRLAKAFDLTEVDLPKDARQAPVESVTLPQTLNLEEFDLEEDETLDREFDNHLRNQEDITLTDQIPTGVDPYVAVTFDEDIIQESTPMDVDTQATVPVSERPGETDVEMATETEPNSETRDFNVDQDTETFGPRNDTEEIPEFHDPRPSNLTEPVDPSTERINSPRSVPEIEIMRDAGHDLSPPPSAAQQRNVRVEGTETLDDILNEKEPTIPTIEEEEEILTSRGPSTFELRSGSPGFAGTEEERGNFGEHPSPQLVLQPSPPPQPQARPRKRKQHFDKVTVLSNRIMRERVEDSSDTLRKRNKLPSSKVDVWRLNNQSQKDQIFHEPLFTGVSDVLRSVFEKDCVSSKPYLAVTDETIPEPASVSSPIQEAETEINPPSPIPQPEAPDSANPASTVELSPVQQTEDIQGSADPRSAQTQSVATEARSPQTFTYDDMEIERLREGGYTEDMPSPPPGYRTDDSVPQPGTWDAGSYRTEPSSSKDTGSYRTEPSTSKGTGSYRTEPSTSANTEDSLRQRHSGLSAIPEMVDEDLYFLEVGSNTPVDSPASQDTEALTGRARALANYLKERSSSSPSSSNPSGDLSLSKILEGKTRKIAARMFFETLVLKTRGLIDMHQEEAYSDISLKLMPALYSKVQL